LPAKRTITNRRYYTDEELAVALRLPRQHKPRATISYCRVSSQAQKPDLQNQQAALEKFCQTHQTELVVVMDTETLSPEQELVQDLMVMLEEEGGQDLIQQVKGLLCKNMQQTFPFPQ
jgi:predicted site-specific integrase-resolvase